MTATVSLEDAHRNLISAKADFEARQADASAARRAETLALNTLNEAQKAFDVAYAETRKALAPPGSDWAQRKPEWKGAEI